MKLRNKNVLIFGGESGIGKAIAVRFIEAGAKALLPTEVITVPLFKAVLGSIPESDLGVTLVHEHLAPLAKILREC